MASNTFHEKDFPVVLFDSQCLLCNGFVRWIIHRDDERKLKFSGLQSTKSLHEIQKRQIPIPENGTAILLFRNHYLTEADAAIEIMRIAQFPSILINIIQAIPPSWQNRIYKWVSRNRYRFFPKRNYCPMPEPSEASRFV